MSGSSEGNRWLGPMDRAMEALFGLIMVLTFTGSLSVWTAGRQDVREMLIGAVGCNLAWGVIDACFYLMGILAGRGRGLQLVHRLQATKEDKAIVSILAEAMPEVMVDLMTPSERETLRQRIAVMPETQRPKLLAWSDLKAALSVFAWVFVITFPVVLPFVFMSEAVLALRVSNAIAIVLLGTIGWLVASYAGFRKWLAALLMVVFGCITVAFTIALGG